jgi:hypothetical protein
MSTPAQADHRAACQSKHAALHIANRKLAFQAQGAVVSYRYFCFSQWGLLLVRDLDSVHILLDSEADGKIQVKSCGSGKFGLQP